MKERILTNWSLIRVLYLVMGLMVVVQAIMSRHWIGVAFGAYFAAMGLFSFGCASGSCYDGNCATDPRRKSNTAIQDVEFEEVKVN